MEKLNLVIGANGHLGNNLIRLLLKKGEKVRASVRNINYYQVNPPMTISYSIQQAGFVQLTIYDESGRLVRTLVNEEKPAGRHSALWDGKNDKGKFISSGKYFYTLKVGKNTLIFKRMILMKYIGSAI